MKLLNLFFLGFKLFSLFIQMYRKLVPSRENSSLIIRSMGVEMLAGCVLTPVMSMFSPGTSFFYP
jgi:hypothetical protein